VAIGRVITSVRWIPEELGGPEHARKWMDLYFSEELSSGEYLGLYDIAYEKPEGYVIRKKDGSVYYSFFDEQPFDTFLDLRGLNPSLRYRLVDYENNIVQGVIEGKEARFRITSRPGNNQGEPLYYSVLKCIPI
jgi:hypothetical protein